MGTRLGEVRSGGLGGGGRDSTWNEDMEVEVENRTHLGKL
jgi:hypothetical protein